MASEAEAETESIAFYLHDNLLMRKWCPAVLPGVHWNVTEQVVVPAPFRSHILSIAHEGKWSGNLEVTKTYNSILRHFYWPGLKSDGTTYCRSCHVCQVVGKPNQIVPHAPLHPIPAIGEPFEHVIVDCGGPLPRTKLGHQFLLTIMCTATRYPEAIPLRRITTGIVTRALLKFFSTFGLPRVLQTDQGSNFTARLFAQVMRELRIKHTTSSPYHPVSQGALERWHQTLKAMLKKYCQTEQKDWDEGLPFHLFAIHDATQESLGFSPAELVFGHSLRGPLSQLKEVMLEDASNRKRDVLQFRERLLRSRDFARQNLKDSQESMKRRYDRSALERNFEVGDKVLMLNPTFEASFAARFDGPLFIYYYISEKLRDTDYIISTPERCKNASLSHQYAQKIYRKRSASFN